MSAPLQLPIDSLRAPGAARRRLSLLEGNRDTERRTREEHARKLDAISKYLAISDSVEDALDKLSQRLFGDLIVLIENRLTEALQEILQQPIVLKIEHDYRHGSVSLDFQIHRNGQPEDVMRGQGGSVVNILSVGLRMFALMTLDERRHRRFLVLDEQDCWLRPDVIPKLVQIVSSAGRELGFQVLMISHHDTSAFERFADRIYHLVPAQEGVLVRAVHGPPAVSDPA